MELLQKAIQMSLNPQPSLVLTHYSQLLLLIQHKNIYISFFEGALIYFPFVTKKKNAKIFVCKLGRQIEGICCCLLSSVKCERGKKKFIYKNKNAKWNYFNGCIFYVYGAAKKKNKRKLLSFGGEGKKFSVYIKKIMLRVNER